MTVDKQALLDAVNDLIEDENPQQKLEALEAVFEVLRRHPVRLAHPMSVLNPLLKLRKDDPDSWERVKELIDRKCLAAGRPPCWPAPVPLKFIDRKNEYQREFMLRKRERLSRVSEIENMQRDPQDRLIGNAKLDFERHRQSRWAAERDALIEKARQAAGGKLSKETTATIRDQFWDRVDAELDALEEAVRVELLKPKHLRRKL